jgi:POT family proton-dependent oligopeptide transporter
MGSPHELNNKHIGEVCAQPGPDGIQAPAEGTLKVQSSPEIPEKAGWLKRFLGGHPLGFWFIFWGEFAERCSYYGMSALLARYIDERLQLGEGGGFTGISLFKAGCYFLPLLGGWVADRFFGKYWTIVGFSIPYILGHFILGFENIPCLIFALMLLAMGSGVIKPNISTLMGMTYDQQRPGQEVLRSNAFAYFYLAINIGAFIGQAALPPIRTQFDYWVAFLVPAGLMVIAFLFFAAGKPFYARETIAPVLSPEERRERWRVFKAIAILFLPILFFWAVFDQGSSVWVYFARDYLDLHLFGVPFEPDQMQAVNGFLIIVLLPLVTLLWNVLAYRGVKVRPTDKMIVGFVLTAGVLVIFVLVAGLTGEAEVRTVTAKVNGNDLLLSVKNDEGVRPWRGTITHPEAKDPEKVKAQLALGAESVEVLGTLKSREDGRRSLTLTEVGPALGWLKARTFTEENPVKTRYVEPERIGSLWWEVLAYFILTVAEILISVTGLELAFVVAPKTMKGFITGVWLAVIGAGNLFVNIPLAWPYDRLPVWAFFSLQLGIMVGVIVAFCLIARRFNRMQAEATAGG